MQLESLRRFLLSLPHATVRRQWGDEWVFKIGALRMFAVCSVDGATLSRISFKVEPADFDELIGHTGIIPAPYMQRAQWVALTDALAMEETELRERLRHSYELNLAKLTKKERAGLESGGGSDTLNS